ncbi:MAG: alkaline phosphatase D family protein [Acidobacteria bacterium]|nr:alkaline phosphatase D family protein [Acidobacteriota bacterium]
MRRSLAAGAGMLSPAMFAAGAPAILSAQGARPLLPQGVASGALGDGRAIVWSRADRPARMVVEYSTTESFRDVRRVRGPAALEAADFTARVVLADLPVGQRIFYRVTFQDLTDLRLWSEPSAGSFSTAASESSRDVKLAWSADTVGQGWGINPDWGGLRLYDTMRRAEPDIFVNCGDTIYADQPLVSEVTLDDGRVWKNVVTPEKSKAAETLDEFRGNHRYNLLDEHMRRFNAHVPQIVTWDDHEVRDNWYETRDLSKDERYRVKSTALLAARATQALFEYTPLPNRGDDPERLYRRIVHGSAMDIFALDMRSYRGANSENRQTTLDATSAILGAEQMVWLKQHLAASRATWKVMVASVPIGLVVRDFPDHFEAVANATDGAPLGPPL